MKKYALMLLTALGTLPLSAIFTPAKAEITIATYNMTHANKNDGKNREAGNCEVIKELNADFYCLQEVIRDKNQLQSIKDALPGYLYIGEPRNSKLKRSFAGAYFRSFFAQDEYTPIFYNPKKVDLISSETFGINVKGQYLPRACTVGQFKEKTTKKELYIYNTHLDNKEEDSRIMQTNIIIDDIKQRCGTMPVILTGDFNTAFAGEMKKNFSDVNFTHAKEIAAKTEGPSVTHEKSNKQLTEIDHILIKPKNNFRIKLYKVLNTMGKKTSDHNPVSMTFSLK